MPRRARRAGLEFWVPGILDQEAAPKYTPVLLAARPDRSLASMVMRWALITAAAGFPYHG